MFFTSLHSNIQYIIYRPYWRLRPPHAHAPTSAQQRPYCGAAMQHS